MNMVAGTTSGPPPPPPPSPSAETVRDGPDHSPFFLGPTSVLYALALLLSVARVYSRVQLGSFLAWDNYTLIMALVSHVAYSPTLSYRPA